MKVLYVLCFYIFSLLIYTNTVNAQQYDFAIFYNGTRDWEDGVVAFEKFLDYKNISHTRITASYINLNPLSNYKVLFFPGGDADFYNSLINQNGVTHIRNFVINGGSYIGICAGADYACDKLIWEGIEYDYPLDLFKGTAIGPIDNLAVWPKYSMTTVNMNKSCEINKFQPLTKQILYWGGTYFEPNNDANIEVIATFANYQNLPAIISFYYQKGRVLLISPHPEIEEDSERDNTNVAEELKDWGTDWDFLWSATDWLLGKNITNITSIVCEINNNLFEPIVTKPEINVNATYPFPCHKHNYATHIKPSGYTENQLDQITATYYELWKEKFLKNSCGDKLLYRIYFTKDIQSVSEGIGYGMMITAYFAGYDEKAKIYFDGLYKYYKNHHSINNQYLMDWQQISCNDEESFNDASASDGDIDIAFSLLLAHCQWGSNGKINYLEEAKKIINAIWEYDINQTTFTVKLGDWCNQDSYYINGTRSSDFIVSHFKAFSLVDNHNWQTVIDNCYNLLEYIQSNYSEETGLIPDFIIDITKDNPKPAYPYYLESAYDGIYYYNACRVPLRIGTDYLLTGDIRGKNIISKINNWLITSTNQSVSLISSGYKLNGEKLYNWNDSAFLAPFAVGAMVDINNQTWLDSLFEDLINSKEIANEGYYSSTLKLLSLLIISGNYFTPNNEDLGIINTKRREKCLK